MSRSGAEHSPLLHTPTQAEAPGEDKRFLPSTRARAAVQRDLSASLHSVDREEEERILASNVGYPLRDAAASGADPLQIDVSSPVSKKHISDFSKAMEQAKALENNDSAGNRSAIAINAARSACTASASQSKGSNPGIAISSAHTVLFLEVKTSLEESGVAPEKLFRSLDSTGRGQLSPDDFNELTLAYWPELGSREYEGALSEIFHQVNRSGTGGVDLQEFCLALGLAEAATTHALAMYAAQTLVERIRNTILDMQIDVERLFRSLDARNCGYLKREELDKMTRAFEKQITRSDAERVFKLFDLRGDGRVDLLIFCETLGLSAKKGLASGYV